MSKLKIREEIKEELKRALITLVISLAVVAIWNNVEYSQFGELQLDRVCDSVVSVIYTGITYVAVSLYRENKKIKEVTGYIG